MARLTGAIGWLNERALCSENEVEPAIRVWLCGFLLTNYSFWSSVALAGHEIISFLGRALVFANRANALEIAPSWHRAMTQMES